MDGFAASYTDSQGNQSPEVMILKPRGFAQHVAALALIVGGLLVGTHALAQGERAQTAISEEQARAAALVAVPGAVLEIELENENGRLVYEVEIRPAAGGPAVEVLVDAASGAVLGSPQADDEDSDRDGTDDDD
jgi:uncharacterized membrane protein YkoI